MGLVSDECKEAIRSRVPIEEILREYHVNLAPAGRRLRALCPFHAEKTPSFYVDVERQTYHCFGCQEHGDVFSFVQRMHQVDFPQALELLARRAGVTLDLVPGAGERTGRKSLLRVYDALKTAAEFYHRFLLDDPSAKPAREYLERRGISRASWERFQLGYSPPEWDGLLKLSARLRVSVEDLEAAGLVRRREQGGGHYDYFRGRLMFPVTDPQGRAIGFGARTLGDDVPKYLNSPRTAVFDKSQILYALPLARMGIQREGRIAIVEGYTDAIVAHQAGLDFVVASLGTAFTADNARRLSRVAPRVVLVFDGDAAGQKASERSLELLLEENLDVRIYTVTDGKDPCEAILALGPAEFRRRLDADAVGIFEFKWRRTVDSPEARAGGPALRARALDEFLELVARVPNIVARKLYVREFAERIGVAEGDLEARLRQLKRRQRSGSGRGSSGNEPVVVGAGSRVRDGTTETKWREAELGFKKEEVSAGDAAGEAVRDGWELGHLADRQGKLEELVVECLLALPEKAEAWLPQVPADFVRSRVLCQIVEGIRRQIEEGAFSPTRLVRQLEDSEASRCCLELLSRSGAEEEDRPAADYEEVWFRLQRDIWRQERQVRLERLRRAMAEESQGGETERLRSLRKEYFEIMRELKRGGAGG